MDNWDAPTVAGFGAEWRRFDQADLAADEGERIFQMYFSVFPWASLPEGAEGFDMGCGSGRWSRYVAPRVGLLHCVEPSAAIDVARRNLADLTNLQFHRCGVGDFDVVEASQDFGYALGVLHHLPDPLAGMRACVAKLKPGAPLLVYLYYALENRPGWYQRLWQLSDAMRRRISMLGDRRRALVADALAAGVYFPLARGSRFLDRAGLDVGWIPLSSYRDRSFYTMRTDSLDRFGTPLERRFTRAEVSEMMRSSGLVDIRFREDAPYWCACGVRG